MSAPEPHVPPALGTCPGMPTWQPAGARLADPLAALCQLERTPPTRRRRPAPLVYALWRGVQHVFDARHIARFFVADRYVCFSHAGQEFLLRSSLRQMQARLRSYGFLLVHRAQLINLAQVASLQRRAGRLHAVLADGQKVPVARRLAARLQAQLAARIAAATDPGQLRRGASAAT